VRRADRRNPDRPHRRQRALPLGGKLRAADRDRPDPLLFRPAQPAPAQPRGDRQLNHALHIIAVTRAQRDPATKEYLARKEAEGKTTKGALRPLKRHLARRFHKLLSEPPADQQQPSDGKPTVKPQPATIDGKLPEIPPRRHPRAPADPNIKGEAPLPMICIS
jgi:hypothetical protein